MRKRGRSPAERPLEAIRALRKVTLAAGYGLAVAGLARDHGEDQLAGFLLDDSGMTLAEFEAAGMDEYDLAELRKLFAAGSGRVARATRTTPSGG